MSEYNESGDIIDGFTQDWAIVTSTNQLGPGIVLDAEAAYTWIDTDPSRLQAVSISTTAMRSKSAWGPV